MSDRNKLFEVHTHNGDSVQLRDISGTDILVTPQSQALSIRWPNGGFIWNRPVAIQVEQEGKVERIPIIDVTRFAQVTLWGLSALFALGTLISVLRTNRVERKEKNE